MGSSLAVSALFPKDNASASLCFGRKGPCDEGWSHWAGFVRRGILDEPRNLTKGAGLRHCGTPRPAPFGALCLQPALADINPAAVRACSTAEPLTRSDLPRHPLFFPHSLWSQYGGSSCREPGWAFDANSITNTTTEKHLRLYSRSVSYTHLTLPTKA